MDESDALELPPGEVVYEEPDEHDYNDESDDGYRDGSYVAPEELSAVDIADLLYTRDWTEIETDAEATAFVTDVLQHATANEREYISNIYHGRSNAVARLKVIADRITALKEYLADIEAGVDVYRQDLRTDDIADTFYDRVPEARPEAQAMNELLGFMESWYKTESETPYLPLEIMGTQVSVRGGGKDGIEDSHDIRIYRLMQLADALHDFDPTPPFKDAKKYNVPREKIIESMDISVPAELARSLEHLEKINGSKYSAYKSEELPPGYSPRSHDMIACIPAFVDFMKENREIQFPDGRSAENPLWDVDLLRRFDVRSALTFMKGELWEAFRIQERAGRHRSGMISSEVWCPLYEQGKVKKEKQYAPKKTASEIRNLDKKILTHKKTVYMAQITSLVTRMKSYFGPGETTFVLDASDDQMSRMIIATEKIDAAIAREFIVKDDERSKNELPVASAKSRSKWHYKVCDANLFDGASHFKKPWMDYADPGVSVHATGAVFRKEDPYKITLLGVNAKKEVTYSLNGAPAVTVSHESQYFSSNNMSVAMQTKIKLGHQDLSEELACKRVCDWGQIEHCKVSTTPENRYVFVSSDRLAGLYAVYRGVSLLSINRKHHDHFQTPTVPKLLQCTFTMYKPEAERNDDLIFDSLGAVVALPKTGGSRNRSFALQVIMGLVAIASAFVPRITA